MRIHSRSPLLATATILCITINASPIQDLSLASSNSTTNNTTLTYPEVFCSDPGAAQAEIVTCLELLVQLPEETQGGFFHNGGALDAFQLPRSQSDSACQVDVTLPYGRDEFSNWPAVRFAANQVIAACTQGVYPSGLTGGYAGIGMGNIWVTIRAPSTGDLGVA